MASLSRGATIALIFILGLTACGTPDPAPIEVAQPEIQVTEVPTETPVEAEEVMPSATEGIQPAEMVAGPEGATVFTLVAGETEASFTIGEVLRGEPKTVVGSTTEVSGRIFIDLNDLSMTKVGLITVQAGSLRTDNNFRNRAIRDFILQTNQYPEITFNPTSIVGLPDEVNPGDSFKFELTGDLTIRQITHPATFFVSVTAESDSMIRGSASSTILRQDFDLRIPSVPQVAGVEPQVGLDLEFLATP